jgi:hypothetical protein
LLGTQGLHLRLRLAITLLRVGLLSVSLLLWIGLLLWVRLLLRIGLLLRVGLLLRISLLLPIRLLLWIGRLPITGLPIACLLIGRRGLRLVWIRLLGKEFDLSKRQQQYDHGQRDQASQYRVRCELGESAFHFLLGLRAAPGSEAIILCFQKVDTQAKTGR